MKGGAAESRVRKFGGEEKKKRRFQRSKQGQTDGEKRQRKSLQKEGVFVSERHSRSRGRAERNNGRKDGGMKG